MNISILQLGTVLTNTTQARKHKVAQPIRLWARTSVRHALCSHAKSRSQILTQDISILPKFLILCVVTSDLLYKHTIISLSSLLISL